MISRMKATQMLALIIMLTVTPSYGAETVADDPPEDLKAALAKCARITANMARLHCYDELAKPSGKRPIPPARSSKSAPELGDTGKWQVDTDKNPVDDTRTVTLALVADEGRSSFREPVALLIRCKSNKTELYITWNDYLGDEAEVLTRVGSGAASTAAWGLSTDSQATFYPGSPVSFIKTLMNADRLVAQVTPYNESPVTAIFDLRGLTVAVAPLRTTCSW